MNSNKSPKSRAALSSYGQKVEKVDTFGEVPLARFGHTIT